ncbi:MAG: fused MFS/spermidine synthase [Candidatus Caenarcaniphilales bacterium]|nr:fused MFS/spermidine synthase [Candidatus Caenarcaniphilales bacterium]
MTSTPQSPSPSIRSRSQIFIPILFSITLIVSAFLLFWVELVFAKQILPYLGGVPAAWTGCMVFFQTILLFGYLWAFSLKEVKQIKVQQLIQLGLLLVCCVFLPLGLRLPESVNPALHPILWLLTTAIYSVALPFFLLASLTPILQYWLASLSVSFNPYVLYAVSNSGSILGLLSFPLLLEATLTLQQQVVLWRGLFVVNLLLIALGLVCVWYLQKKQAKEQTSAASTTETTQEQEVIQTISLKQKLWWILLSFLPSTLLSSSTTYITVDIAPVPLLWALPLVVYLSTFILVFAPKPILIKQNQPIFHLIIWVGIFSFACNFINNSHQIIPILVFICLLLLFLLCWFLHGKLAQDKPSPKKLTTFYLCIALGGMLGGVFNCLIAPLIFNGLYEYPIGVLLGILVFAYTQKEALVSPLEAKTKITTYLINTSRVLTVFALFFINIALSYWIVKNNNSFEGKKLLNVVAQHRSFFGTYKVIDIFQKGKEAPHRILKHGSTVHGRQYLAADKRKVPCMYYAASEPIADVFQTFPDSKNVAIIGLGTGGLATYSKPQQAWDFYEVDSTIKTMAEKYFTYLKDSPAKNKVIIGDARLEVAKSKSIYDIFVLDAFNSDFIPVHLLTKEAFDIYKNHLSTDGFMVFHISNRYLKLAPVINAISRSDERFIALSKKGKNSEYSVVLRKDNSKVPKLLKAGWKPILESTLWTDNYSNIFLALKK